MIFITGPLYSGKRTFAPAPSGRCIAEVQALAAEAEDNSGKLAEELSAYDIVMATEVGGGVVPMDAGERAAREAAGTAGLPAGGPGRVRGADVLRHPHSIERRIAGMLIYLLRHGLTAYNAEKRYQGQRDIPLSAAGRAVLRRADFRPEDGVYYPALPHPADRRGALPGCKARGNRWAEGDVLWQL